MVLITMEKIGLLWHVNATMNGQSIFSTYKTMWKNRAESMVTTVQQKGLMLAGIGNVTVKY